MRPLLISLFVLLRAVECSLSHDLIGDPPVRDALTRGVTGHAEDAWVPPALAPSGARDAVLAHDAGPLPAQLVPGNAPCLHSGAVAGQGDAASVQVESVHLLEAPGTRDAAEQQRGAMCPSSPSRAGQGKLLCRSARRITLGEGRGTRCLLVTRGSNVLSCP
jgi:hypothetical protein